MTKYLIIAVILVVAELVCFKMNASETGQWHQLKLRV